MLGGWALDKVFAKQMFSLETRFLDLCPVVTWGAGKDLRFHARFQKHWSQSFSSDNQKGFLILPDVPWSKIL
jgi:hypothetical protein